MKLLIVDDALLNRRHYEMMLAELEDCTVVTFDCAEKAFAWCENVDKPDFVVSDYMLPGMNGLDFCARIRALPGLSGVPLLMISACDDKEIRRKAFELGVLDFVPQPVDHHEFPRRIKNLLTLRRQVMDESSTADWLAEHVRRATNQLLAQERQIVNRVARIAEYRDPETGLHATRVGHIAKVVAQSLGLSKDTVDAIFLAAPLHDVGKISVPDYILVKSGKLTKLEFEIMKQHTVVGYELLHDDGSALLNMAADIAVSHHERFDGSGYPYGLMGDKIPIAGQICAIADTFDVLTSARPYKEAWKIEDAIAEVRRCRGTQFAPQIVGAFDRSIVEIVSIRQEMMEQTAASSSPEKRPTNQSGFVSTSKS